MALSWIGDDEALRHLEEAINYMDEDVSNSALISFESLSYAKGKREKSETAVKPRIRL